MLNLSGVGEQVAGFTEVVQRAVGKGDVLLQHGAVAAPFTQALAQDEEVVGEAEGVGEKLLAHG
jgi:hypothetical protein